jgi:hypothetical protein
MVRRVFWLVENVTLPLIHLKTEICVKNEADTVETFSTGCEIYLWAGVGHVVCALETLTLSGLQT